MARFSEPQDPLFQALNASISFDLRLAPFDVEQSLAHARMLARAGIVSEEDRAQLEGGLEQVLAEIEADEFELRPGDEDVHMAVERRLTELVGPVGGKLHTARSRNDQVAADLHLWLKGACADAVEALAGLVDALVGAGRAAGPEAVVPGLTHQIGSASW